MGRPTDYNEQLAAVILARIADGQSLKRITSDDGMPHASTVYRWLMDPTHKQFSDKYARAAEDRATALAEEALEIADDNRRDFIETEDGTKFNSEHVQRSRLRVDTRKWFAARLNPKKYGDRVSTEVSGPDGGPVKTEVTSITRRIVFPNKPDASGD